MSWQPSASIDVLKARAHFFKKVRAFFDERHCYEVDPPLLSAGVATDPYLDHFDVMCNQQNQRRFLQTSPEFAMKRLLAAGSGPIYCLGKAFRKGEVGHRHNPEFMMLEWYRPNWDHHQLMCEVDEFVSSMIGTSPATHITYEQLFQTHFDLNPHTATLKKLQACVLSHDLVSHDCAQSLDKDGCLDLLMSTVIEPTLGQKKPLFVTEYPASQASLACIRERNTGDTSYHIGERFEYYVGGMELANGYHELICSKEQEERFVNDIETRAEKQLPTVPLDTSLLSALAHGMPPCAGVALGIDRLFMLHQKAKHISDVLPFDWERA